MLSLLKSQEQLPLRLSHQQEQCICPVLMETHLSSPKRGGKLSLLAQVTVSQHVCDQCGTCSSCLVSPGRTLTVM